MDEKVIYTDGGCLGNPGPGGWAFIAVLNGKLFSEYGAEKETTNNRMELTAVISALRWLEIEYGNDEQISLHTDSLYVKKGITIWIDNWKKNGWKTAGKKPVKNRDLWLILDELNARLSVQWFWVKGHADDPMNIECDLLVRKAINKII